MPGHKARVIVEAPARKRDTQMLTEFRRSLPIDDALPALTRSAAARTTPPCSSPRPAPARPRACRWCSPTSPGPSAARSSCWSRAASRRARPPTAWRTPSASAPATPSACACASARKSRRRTRIEVVTEGVFTRLILDDPELERRRGGAVRRIPRALARRRSRPRARARRAAGPARGPEDPRDVGDHRRRARRRAARRRAGGRERRAAPSRSRRAISAAIRARASRTRWPTP